MTTMLFQNRYLTISLLLLMFCSTAASANQHHLKKRQTIQPERIRATVHRYIIQKAPWNSDQMVVRKIKVNRPLAVPLGKTILQVTAPKHSDWLGHTAFTVRAMVNGKEAAAITVPALIEVWSDVMMTTKPLGKYQPIEQEDIQVQKMNLARVPSGALVDIRQVLGRRANRNIAANCILRKDHVEIPPLVKRGDLVKVVAESDHIKISVKAIVKENGRQGDRIKVVNLRSKKAIYAMVVDDQTVRVEF